MEAIFWALMLHVHGVHRNLDIKSEDQEVELCDAATKPSQHQAANVEHCRCGWPAFSSMASIRRLRRLCRLRDFAQEQWIPETFLFESEHCPLPLWTAYAKMLDPVSEMMKSLSLEHS